MKLFRALESLPAYLILASGFLLFGWAMLVAALFGFLTQGYALFFLGITLFTTLFALSRLMRDRDWLRLSLWIGFFLLVAFSVLAADPSIFSGRDQGSQAEAAWRLAQNHTVSFSTMVSHSFFDIYGPGTALNFPGFSYIQSGALVTQFPLGYVSFLAGFVSLFSLSGFALANTFLLFLFLVGLFELLFHFMDREYALAGTLLAFFSFLPWWIGKLTLSENLAAFLFVSLALCLVRFFQERTLTTWWPLLTFACFFPFVRIEGYAFLLVTLGLLFFHKDTRLFLVARKKVLLLLPGILFLFLFLRDFLTNLPFYKLIGKALLKTTHEFSTLGSLPDTAGSLGLGSVFFSYGLLVLFLIGIFGIVYALFKKEYAPLLIALLALPSFVYLVLPSITPDHPWMLRRYYPSLFPTFVFFSAFGLSLLGRQLFWPKKYLLALFLLLLLPFQVKSFLTSYSSNDHQGLWNDVSAWGSRFQPNDLLLIDRMTTGDPYTMLPAPLNFLLEKQAVYFFNPGDLTRLDTSPYKHIYLLTPEDGFPTYTAAFGDKLLPIETVTFKSPRLIPSQGVGTAPTIETLESTSILFEIQH